eukprot:6436765-Pyramimonas_sp.AAC.1
MASPGATIMPPGSPCMPCCACGTIPESPCGGTFMREYVAAAATAAATAASAAELGGMPAEKTRGQTSRTYVSRR